MSDDYSDNIYNSYRQLPVEELQSLAQFYTKLSQTPVKSAPHTLSQVCNNIVRSSPQLQRLILWRGAFLTFCLAIFSSFVIAILMGPAQIYQQLIIAAINGCAIGFVVCVVMAKMSLRKHIQTL